MALADIAACTFLPLRQRLAARRYGITHILHQLPCPPAFPRGNDGVGGRHGSETMTPINCKTLLLVVVHSMGDLYAWTMRVSPAESGR
jgi:hypothetical protein